MGSCRPTVGAGIRIGFVITCPPVKGRSSDTQSSLDDNLLDVTDLRTRIAEVLVQRAASGTKRTTLLDFLLTVVALM